MVEFHSQPHLSYNLISFSNSACGVFVNESLGILECWKSPRDEAFGVVTLAPAADLKSWSKIADVERYLLLE